MTYLKVVGFGPFPWPGEKRRWQKAEDEARRMVEILEEMTERSKDVADLR